MLRHIVELGLRAVHEALALKSTRADGYLRLRHIVGRISVFLDAEQDTDARALIVLHHIVEGVVRSIEKPNASEREGADEEEGAHALSQPLQTDVADHGDSSSQLCPTDVEWVNPKGNGISNDMEQDAP